MSFDWKHFLSTLVTIAPAVVVGSMAIAKESGTADKLQTASDALHLATGVTSALASDNPNVVAGATQASAVIDSVIAAISASKKK